MAFNSQLIVYEVESDIVGFRYKVWFFKDQQKWRIDHIQLIRGFEPFLPRRYIDETFDSECALIDCVIKYCDIIVKHLSTEKYQEPEMGGSNQNDVDPARQA